MTNSIKRLTGTEGEEGFTLIELMVVVLIIGILMAIAIPTFLGAKKSANSRASQSNLRNAVTAESTYFSNGSQAYGYTADVSPLETALAWGDASPVSAAPAGGNGVSIYMLTGASPAALAATGTRTGTVVLGELGKDGNAYYVYDNSGQVYYSQVTNGGSFTATLPTSPTGLPASAASAANGAWSTGW